MSFTNYKDSQNDVLTTIAPVLDEWIKAMIKEMPNTALVYDPELSYETAVKALRDSERYNEDESKQIPLLAFRRNVMRTVENQSAGRRLPYQKIINGIAQEDHPTILGGCMGEFQIEYIYFTKDIQAAEQFEVAHAAKRGVTGVRALNVYISDEIKDLPYNIKHEDLSDLTVNNQTNYYKALGGILLVHGVFLLFEAKGRIIEEVNTRISSYVESIKDSTPIDTMQINS